eukprot:GHVU01019996.1.p1 GENE.GHVU01019996.1~~GHVU01019996.1.p1  ORF type:complete len:232 (+),score=10.17 GHVU01019996.1:36-698(+)
MGYNYDTNSMWCGAVLISDTWALTAAHCVDGELAATYEVRIGDHNRVATSGHRRLRRQVPQYIMHEAYDSRTLENDIALVQFDSSIGAFNESQYPACKPTNGDYAGSQAPVSGWGTLESGTNLYPDILEYTVLPIMDDVACVAVFGREWFPGMVCAGWVGDNPRDSCQGDSGGPLAVKHSDGLFDVVGLVSWGYGCASTTPGVYTRVSDYIAWIEGKINL